MMDFELKMNKERAAEIQNPNLKQAQRNSNSVKTIRRLCLCGSTLIRAGRNVTTTKNDNFQFLMLAVGAAVGLLLLVRKFHD